MLLNILVIDDEADIRELICDALKDENFVPRAAANSTQAFKAISEKLPHAIILDIWLQGSDLDGLGILEIVRKRYPNIPVIIISGHGTIETAVSAIKMGAYDYIEKPFTHDKLIVVLKRACELAKLKRENFDLKSKTLDKTELIGISSITTKLKSDIEKVALTSGRVMIYGDSGSGKELTARLIHKKSKRSTGPFIVFSPTGMREEKVLQELFGEAEKQDLNGIFVKRTSVLEAANNGSLYINQVSDLPMSAQTKLLKFLQDQILEKPGSDKIIKLDIRVIADTTMNLTNLVNEGKFRQDLFFRLNVVPIKVPSLAERREDIPLLVKYFVKQLSKFSGLKEREFSEDALAVLQGYGWTGNIRQLRNIIEWTLIMNPIYHNNNYIIKSDMLPNDIISNGLPVVSVNSNLDTMSMPLREAREVFEKQYLSAQMSRFNNNISKTSNFVGMERSALHRKLKLLNINNISNKINDDYTDDIY